MTPPDGIDPQLLSMMTSVSFDEITKGNRQLERKLRSLDRLSTAATFGALLLEPKLQSNTFRLEVLVHLALMISSGKTVPTPAIVSQLYGEIGNGHCGRMEDSAEDLFVVSIGTGRGNFRILEGIWESSQFYLQRVVNVIEQMPRSDHFDAIRESVFALLQLSDMVCERAGLRRNLPGNPNKEKRLPIDLIKNLARARKRVLFSDAELRTAGISLEYLSQFLIDPKECKALLGQSPGHTTLERYPLAHSNSTLFFLLPTATSSAIRRFALQAIGPKNRRPFLAALAKEYAELFSRTPLLGEGSGADIEFRQTKNGLLAGVSRAVDRGRFVNFVFFVDNLDAFETTGLLGSNPDPALYADDFDKWIDVAYESARKRKEFVGGITLLVGCGIGRGVVYWANNKSRQGWQLQSISAADLYTLSWTPDFNSHVFWRMFESRQKISSLGVTLHNANGLLNLVAWMRSLDGHLIPHGSLPDGFIKEGNPAHVSIEQAAIRQIRHEVADAWDPHVQQYIDGRWLRVRKAADSEFAEERARPLYAVEEKIEAHGPPIAYVSGNRTWWVTISFAQNESHRSAYDYWKMLSVWLSRAVPQIEKCVSQLPDGSIALRFEFLGAIGSITEGGEAFTVENVRSDIRVQLSSSPATCSIVVGQSFERALHNAKNISEHALVEAIVHGAELLAGTTLSKDAKDSLLKLIVPSTMARHMHAFRGQNFRDYVQPQLGRKTITIERTDDAFLKLGLGWRERDIAKGAFVKGKNECAEFLSVLVESLENELCADLKQFDRRKAIEFFLRNHETAAVDRDRWRRTSGAVLGLHEDKAAVLEAMARHDFKLNAVFLATRLLTEFALCECPLEGPRELGRLDLSLLMGKAAQIHGLGGWSDAIRWDAMEAELRITPLGDVHTKQAFLDDVVEPFAHRTNEVFINSAVEDYGKNVEEPEVRPTVHSIVDAHFLEAWNEQCGASIDDFRLFMDFLEELGIERKAPVLKLPRSQLLNVTFRERTLSKHCAEAIVSFWTLANRSRWRDIPDGFDAKDIQPWRFRRRLAVLRKPIIQINNEMDPQLIVAPGIVRDAFGYTLGGLYRGDFPAWQLTTKMKEWAGKEAHRKGTALGREVAERLGKAGWKTECELRITKLLKEGFQRDYGDVDVLAWTPDGSRVLIIECKDVQYRKTLGEIAEQLADFRGEIGSDGKPDLLRRHLDRVDLIGQRCLALAKYIGVESVSRIESHLIFKNPVPMQFALERISQRVAMRTVDQLNQI